MVVNGTSIQASSESGESEVPIKKGDSVSSDPGKLSLITQMTGSYTSTFSEEKNCSYEYKMDLKVRTGKFEDYNFTLVPYKEERGKQAVTVRLYTNQSRSGEGLDVVMWDYEKQELVPVKDNQTIEMDPVKYKGSTTTTRQVRIFFAKPKAGYEFVNGLQSAVGVMYGQPHGDNPLGDGRMNDANAGTIDAMTATSLIRGDNPFKIYNDQWQAAQKAAKEKGYTRYLAWGGARPLLSDNGWRLYSASFMVASSSLYVHYNSGAGMGVLPKSADVKNIPDNPETRSSNKTPMHSYGKDLETGKGTRAIGTTFIMGEGWAEPTCEGYEFIGWKLKNKDGELSQKTYSNGELFTISDENYGYANNTNLPVFASNNFTGYQIVAQWKKIDTKKVEVKHWLKVPNSKKILGKTTAGTISFATENESVKAYAKPEANGTFPGYVFDTEDPRNKKLEKEVKNDSSSDTITLNLYYKPTVLKVSKTVTGYNMEPNRSYEFKIKAVPPSGTDASIATITDGQIFIRKGNDEVENLTFTKNQATFNLAKGEFVDISCLPTGWTYTVTETDPGKNYKTSYKLNGSNATDGRTAEFRTSTTGNDTVDYDNTQSKDDIVLKKDGKTCTTYRSLETDENGMLQLPEDFENGRYWMVESVTPNKKDKADKTKTQYQDNFNLYMVDVESDILFLYEKSPMTNTWRAVSDRHIVNHPQKGGVTVEITKEVTGPLGNRKKPFDMEILYWEDGQKLRSKTIRTSLKHGDKVTLKNVDISSDIIITETVDTSKYAVSISKKEENDKYSNPVQATSNGNTAVMKQRIEAARGDVIELKITNENTQLIPETGVRLETSRHVWLLFAISIIMILFFRRRRKIR